MSKRGAGWADMDYRYKHNRMPEAPVVTKYQQLLAAIHMGEEDALLAARMPGSMAARALRQGLQENGLYRNHFVPERILQAFGLLVEVEGRAEGEWQNARSNGRKERAVQYMREKRASLPLLEKVKG